MNPALISDELPRGAHRLLWWLIAHQERDEKGQPTGVVGPQWRELAREELNISKVAMWRMEKHLKAVGITEGHKFSRYIRIRGEAFN